MKGKLYGIGVGPGDPELITLKAINAIKNSDVIAVPHAKNGEKTALKIIQTYLQDQPLLECHFYMKNDLAMRKEHRLKAANDICALLEEGKKVGFITLGDPCVYSTYMYVHKIIEERGFETEIIPGITSFSAVAAKLGVSLCEEDELLHIIPASSNDNIEKILECQGNKIIMKSNKNLQKVLSILKENGFSKKTKIVQRCGMIEEKVFNSIDEFNSDNDTDYFSVIIVKD